MSAPVAGVAAVTAALVFGISAVADQRMAPVQAIFTTADPVISIALAILWLGARLRGSPAEIAGEVGSLVLMTAGIVTVARYARSEKAQPSAGMQN